jgi:uncharacterized membrane protein YedE/YeeE
MHGPHLMPPPSPTVPCQVSRVALAGLLVGMGASMGNGCTSGHGICGNARLSVRSVVYTLTFMAAGALIATAAATATALNILPAAPALQGLAAADLRFAAVVGSAGAAAFAALAACGHVALPLQAATSRSTSLILTLELAAEAVAGALFALGLGLAGMTRPAKVAAFLSATHPAWDPSLLFVMGGAVLVAALAFAAVQRLQWVKRPALVLGGFSIPTNSAVDMKLMLGGALFGAGWGLAGLCPGPAVVSAAGAMSPHSAAFIAAMLLGMWAEPRVGTALLPSLR